MPLETTCPHCDTRFQVAPDQLRQRGGLVRCGLCQRVFSGLEHLADSPAPDSPAASDPTDSLPSAGSPPTGLTGLGRDSRDVLGREPDPFSDALVAAGPRPSPRAVIIACLLAITLLAQVAIGWRDAIAARMPALAPVLAAAVAPLGLDVQPPRELDAVTIEAFDLQAGGPGQLLVSALVRNRAAHPVRWPSLELTLTDETGGVLIRRTFTPDEFMPDGARGVAGLPPRSEHDIRVILANAGPPPKGYSVSLFHP
jgi:predicted Zn finger-like uncharacterized protein